MANMRRLSVYQTQPRAGDSYESSLLVAAIKAGEMDLEIELYNHLFGMH